MSGGVPAGWVLVPKVATEAMERAALEKVGPYHDLGDEWQTVMPGDLFRLAWPAMLAAVPTPTPPIEGRDADVERVARALCVADGLDPDEHIVGGQATGFEDYGPLWQAEDRSEGQLGLTDYTGLARAALQALGERP